MTSQVRVPYGFLRAFTVACIVFTFCANAVADTVAIPASKDNTLYEDPAGQISNGAGERIFAGMTALASLRRAVIAFDVAAVVPAGSTIDDATLQLNMSLTISGPMHVSLHRLQRDWGEGASDALGQEGTGTQAEPGDATWLHTFYHGSFWGSAGGDYDAAASAVAAVDQIGLYFWNSADMATDVQGWLDTPASNFGWIVIGEESANATAKRFDSSENPDPNLRPSLRVTYTPPGPGAVPDGDETPGQQLMIQKGLGINLVASWGASCSALATDYEVYEGTLGSFPDHVAVTCTTAGATSLTFGPSAGDRYYLIVPRNASQEGSYGLGSDDLERPPGNPACFPQLLGGCP